MDRHHTAALALALAGTLSFSTDAHAAADSGFAQLDNNGDGLISYDEYLTKRPVSGRLHPRRIFDNVDRNLDGFIDSAEFAAMKQRRGH